MFLFNELTSYRENPVQLAENMTDNMYLYSQNFRICKSEYAYSF